MGDGPLPHYAFCMCLRAVGCAAMFALRCFFACLQTWRKGASWQASGQRLRGFHRAWSRVTKHTHPMICTHAPNHPVHG